MKMRILFIFVCLLCSMSLFAQREPLYEGIVEYQSDTIQMNGYAYICDTRRVFDEINIYNLQNHPGRGDIVYADTGKYPEGSPFKVKKKFVGLTDSQKTQLRKIVNDCFTVEQANLLGGSKMKIALNIATPSGIITDVYFTIHRLSNYTQIPIDVFRNIELQLKEQVVFNLTEVGRRLNYCYLAWVQCPTGYVAPTLDPDMPFDGSGGGGEGNVQTGPCGSIATEPMRIEK